MRGLASSTNEDWILALGDDQEQFEQTTVDELTLRVVVEFSR
jgi:hypothetical protein